jgi:hypothetical protein
MEAVGVALAILPLLLNQLDNYVQGLETIKGFRAKRYRRELEGYFTSLDAQQTIFFNHLLRSFDGVEYEDEIDELGHNGLGDLLKKQALQSNLKDKLGRNFGPFTQVMREISSLLNELSRKLGWDKKKSVEVGVRHQQNTVHPFTKVSWFLIEILEQYLINRERNQKVSRYFFKKHLLRSFRENQQCQQDPWHVTKANGLPKYGQKSENIKSPVNATEESPQVGAQPSQRNHTR